MMSDHTHLSPHPNPARGEGLVLPQRKNPVLRTLPMNLPPAARGRVALGLTAAAARGHLALQTCADCGAVQYPPREACHHCLSPDLHWQPHAGGGQLLCTTTLHHSNDLYFRQHLPWRVGLVQLDDGPSVMVHLHQALGAAPTRIRIGAALDRTGQAVLIGFPDNENTTMADDPLLRAMTCDPRGRNILVTDAKTALGQALVQALLKAGAASIWAGQAEPWKQYGGLPELAALEAVTLVPLDVTNERSLTTLAGSIGGKVDIVINNAEWHRPWGIGARRGTETARTEMDINYFGLLRLAQAFGPALKARAADGSRHACAWVNLLSIYALANFPAHGTYSASKAAAYSLAQCLRAEMQQAGIRVVNCFPGPLDDEWNHDLPPPKISPAALAGAVVRGLQNGVEDIYPGDVAQEWLARWRDDPKVLEREIAAGVW